MKLDNIGKCNTCNQYTLDCDQADQIPAQLVKVAQFLRNRELFTGKGSIRKLCTVVTLKEHGDSRIGHIFHQQVREILGDHKGWYIREFVGFDENLHTIYHGLTFWPSETHNKATIQEMEYAYKQVLTQMTNGWNKTAIENPMEKDPNEFELFIKQRSFVEEDALLRFLAGKFGLADEMGVYAYSGSSKLQMWIKKESFDLVTEIMGFQFTGKENDTR